MKILIDTNIALDHLLEREPFCQEAEKIIGLTQGGVGVFLSASSIYGCLLHNPEISQQ